MLRVQENKISDPAPLIGLPLQELNINYNYLDLTPGSEAGKTLEKLKEAGVEISYEQQGTPEE